MLGRNACIRGTEINLEERIRVIIEHCDHFEKYLGSSRFVGMRKHLVWYCKGFHGASNLRSQMVRLNNVEEVAKCLRNYETLYTDQLMANSPEKSEDTDITFTSQLHA